MIHHILILDDEQDRIDRFTRAVKSNSEDLVLKTWHDAHTMIDQIAEFLDDARLISLDHELYIGDDPGDGLDVAKHLAEIAPVCPVIVHSSNGDRARAMVGELDFARWDYHRVMPFGDDWVEKEWCDLVRALLHDQ